MTSALLTLERGPSEITLKRKGFAFLIILITLGFSISFRNRDLGETNLDVQNGVKLVFWLLIIGIAFFKIRTLTPLIASPSGYTLLILSILILASATWSERPLYSMACALGFTSYNALASMSLYEFSDDEFYQIICHSLLAFVGLGYITAILYPETAWLPPSVEETYSRLQGLAVNPNNFGRFAALLFLISLGIWTKERRTSLTLLLSMSAGLIGMGLSGSRTALVASIFTATFVSFRNHPLFRFAILSAIILFTALLFLMSYGVTLNTVFRSLSRTGLESEVFTLTGRTDLWSTALEMIRERPLFGWGFNSTEEHFSLLFNQDFYGTPVNPHQMLLHLTLGVGTIGAVLALIIIALRMKTIFTEPDALNDMMILYILIYGLTEVDLFGTPLFTSLIFFRISLKDAFTRRPVS